jgi:hypothetical protein|tara:strand:+ start:326 stop:697 length:372 start_codon:yes stop_codon:yes gene_type:complete
MSWKPKKRRTGKNRYYSMVRKLRREGKSTVEFEVMLNNLSLEDLIALKLELASKVAGSKLYGFKLWHSIPDLVRDAMLKYAMSATRTKNEAQRFLGIDSLNYKKMLKKYQTESFFEEYELTEE